MSLRRTTLALVVLLLLPSIATAAEAPETLLVQRLLEAPQLKEALVAAAGRTASQGTHSEIAMALFRSDERIWKALASELPRWLADRMSRERLEALARSYGENPEQAWGESRAEILALVMDLAQGNPQLAREMARTACSAGFLASNIDEARKKKGTADKPFKAPPEFVEQIQPFLQPIDKSCDCIARHFVPDSGEMLISDQTPREEGAALMLQLIQTGKCPDPFAGFR